jgi:glycosyltransferase involved in cell wall biosynthesis
MAPPASPPRSQRIVYIAGSIVPGRAANAVQVMKMCNALAGHGAQVTLLVPARPERERGVGDVYEYYGVKRAFDIEWLRWPTLPGRGHAFAVIAARRARALCPDLVYGRHLASCAFAVAMGLPTVWESHAWVEPRRWVDRLQLEYLLRRKRLLRVVAISEALRQVYSAKWPWLASRLIVAHDGADPRGSHEPNGGEQKRLRVGYVGSLYDGRGMELLEQLAPRAPDMDFHVVGGERGSVDHWSARMSACSNVTFHGYQTPDRAQSMSKEFDVLVAPYQRRISGWGSGANTVKWMSPLKIFEYMSARRPIICSDLPVLREILEHDRNALLCPPDDVDAWLEALRRVQADPELRKRLGRQAETDLLRWYTWAARAARVMDGLLPIGANE